MGLPKSTLVAAACWLSIAVSSVAQPAPKPSAYLAPFTGAQSGQTVTSQSGWIAKDAAGATTTDATVTINASGNIAFSGGATGQTNPGTRIVVRDAGSTDCVIKCRLTTSVNAATFYMVAAATAAGDAVYIRSSFSSTGEMGTVRLCKCVAGTETQIASISPSLVTTQPYYGRNPKTAALDELELRVIGRTAYMMMNGVVLAGGSIDGGSAFTKGQFCGFGTNGNAGSSVSGVYIAPITGTLTVAAVPLFLATSMAAGGRNLAMAGTYTGTVTALHYRLINPATNTPVQDWRVMTGATISGGNWAGSAWLPTGSVATNPSYVVQVRAYDDQDTAGTPASSVACGYAIGTYGQSNMGNRDNATDTTVTNSTNVYIVRAADNTNTWDRCGVTRTNSSLVQMGITLAASLGIPVGIVNTGYGSQPLSNLAKSGTNPVNGKLLWTGLTEKHVATRTQGFIQAWLWDQGEDETSRVSVFDPAPYKALFAQLCVDLRTDFCEFSTAPVVTAVLGRWDTSAGAAQPVGGTGDISYPIMRAAQMELARDLTGVYVGQSKMFLPMSDALHFTSGVAAAYRELNRIMGLSLSKVVTGAGYDGRGPLVTGGARSGATLTLAVNLNGATSLSQTTAGVDLNSYQVSADDFATTLPLLTVRVVGSNVVITLVADPAAPVKVRSFQSGAQPLTASAGVVTANLAFGTYADSTTIPVEPIYLPITVA